MSKRAQENIIAFIFLFFFIAMIVISFDYSPKARMVPVPIAVVSAVVMLLQIYLMNFRKDIELNVDAAELLTGGRSADSIVEGKVHDEVEEVKVKKIEGGKEHVGLLIVLTYLVMTLLIGIMPAMFLFVFGFFVWISKTHWIKALLIAFVTEISVYILFIFVLEVQFYEGWLVKLILG
ncbi:MAG: hypothetical protein APF84_11135 [Gracilibacter sp. BRH_c7a]|nr:MAG: hypothetical protein APF84_11135 [Gracilibacter sp. BRH_c7a]